jgi:class 3 adenylate cyclase
MPDEAPRTGKARERAARAAAAVRATNTNPEVIRAVRTARELLPGDERQSAETTANRELTLAAVQVWEALAQRLGRGASAVEATILFTELCDFSTWVLQAGDEKAVELLRSMAALVEPIIAGHRGKLVKRLADGHMAVFTTAAEAVEAALEIQAELAELNVEGYRPQLRIGLHCGTPQQMGGDYLGTDVNIAARISEAARAGEVLVSGEVLATIDEEERARLSAKRRRAFRAKGAPPGLQVFSVTRI